MTTDPKQPIGPNELLQIIGEQAVENRFLRRQAQELAVRLGEEMERGKRVGRADQPGKPRVEKPESKGGG